ncbi:ribosomal-protein-alanine N-acetyltransferase [Tenericutes bacterium MZ-XQ]|nr:ribosomal-protein-alanine N-acetyltransferase [Tenericutes bacterium MZ-XQ]
MIRKAIPNDIFHMVRLEKSAFKTTLGEKFLLQELKDNPFSFYYVYELNKTVIGYIGFRVYDDQAEMMNFVVNSDHQDEGYGTQLLTYCLNELEKKHVKTITLEVRKSNKKAQHVYEKMGFKLSHIRKKYYENEDGFVLVKEVSV